MSLKETIVKALTEQGFDFVSACEIATNKIKEIATWKSGSYKIFAGNVEISFRKVK